MKGHCFNLLNVPAHLKLIDVVLSSGANIHQTLELIGSPVVLYLLFVSFLFKLLAVLFKSGFKLFITWAQSELNKLIF